MSRDDSKLAAFLHTELKRESESGFSRFTTIPDTLVQSTLAYWSGLAAFDRSECLEYLALVGARAVGHALGHPDAEAAPHPFKSKLEQGRDALRNNDPRFLSVPILRAIVSTVKMERHRGAPSSVPERWFDYATSIRSVKAPELRKGVKVALQSLDLQCVEKLGGGDFKYVCRIDGLDVEVGIDYGGLTAQLRYYVVPTELRGRGPFGWLTLERSLGLGLGMWDRITDDNVTASMGALCDCVRYVATLPARVEAWLASTGQAAH